MTIGTSGGAATRTGGPHSPAPREVTTVVPATVAMPLEHRLLQRHEVVDRPHLPAVGVARQLQVDATPLDVERGERLVGDEQGERAGIRATERGVDVGRPLALADQVVDPGHQLAGGRVGLFRLLPGGHRIAAIHP